ncbi:T9SS type A sorting domain-containing protein [bacterium]|nr:T9SS type A sorting domain-containing protein [bacterium]
MKKITTISLLLAAALGLKAQYSTPNTGQKYNLDSLVANSGGAVTKSASVYTFNQDVKISKTDTLEILTNETIVMGGAVELNLTGFAFFNPSDSIKITNTQGLTYEAIRIDSSNSIIRKTIIEFGGGIAIYDASPLIDSCIIRNNADGTRGAINLFRSNAIIQNSKIHDNRSSAISSGANIASAPRILNNDIRRNVTYNGNKSQINFGTTGSDTIFIVGNTIVGKYTNAGGIAFLPIGAAQVVIENNFIDSNRYGIGMLTGGITSLIKGNTITNNMIQGNENLGGSGINFAGASTNTAIVTDNLITGNLWGVTIQNTASPNLGDLRPSKNSPGLNVIKDNFNNGIEYNLYNNTPDSIYAQNNDWGRLTQIGSDSTIVDKNDDPSLGVVLSSPLNVITSVKETIAQVNILTAYPNPATSNLTIKNTTASNLSKVSLYNMLGEQILSFDLKSNESKTMDVSNLSKGIYFINYMDGDKATSKKVIVQ